MGHSFIRLKFVDGIFSQVQTTSQVPCPNTGAFHIIENQPDLRQFRGGYQPSTNKTTNKRMLTLQPWYETFVYSFKIRGWYLQPIANHFASALP